MSASTTSAACTSTATAHAHPPATAAQPARIDALGVDVGFFSTKYSFGRDPDTGAIRAALFPSEPVRLAAGLHQLPQSQQAEGLVVEVGETSWFVGPGALQMHGGFGLRPVTDDYSRSDGYRALMLGALAHAVRALGLSGSIELRHLVVGLPLSSIHSHGAALEKMAAGVHRVPGADGRPARITVRQATAIAQPQGALLSATAGCHRPGGRLTALVLDMGGGTFDWFVATGNTIHPARCGAVPIGMLACAQVVCDGIDPTLKHNPRMLARVDEALRSGSMRLRIRGTEHDIGAQLPAVRRTLSFAFERMLRGIGDLDDIDLILLTGGGAALLHRMLAEVAPGCEHMLEVDADPVFANVRGFALLAEQLCAQREAA